MCRSVCKPLPSVPFCPEVASMPQEGTFGFVGLINTVESSLKCKLPLQSAQKLARELTTVCVQTTGSLLKHQH